MLKRILVAALLLFPSVAWAQTAQPDNTPRSNPSLPHIDLVNAAAIATAGTVAIPTNGASTVSIAATGTGSGLTFAARGLDKSGTWNTLRAYVPSTCASVTSMSANGTWLVNSAGFSQVQANLTAISGGTETFSLEASAGVINCPGVGTPTSPSTVQGNVSNGVDAVAPTSTNVPTDGYNYGFNGSGWDRLQVDGNKYLKVAPQAGQLGLGNVGGKTVSVCVTPTVTASNAYGTNYVVGGLLTFANAFTSTGSGLLQGVAVTILDTETSGFTFFPFAANPSGTTWTDATVAAIVAADVPKVRGPVALSGNNQLKSTVFSIYSAAGLGEALAPGSTTLYGVLIANAALTNNFAGTSDVQVCVKVLDDE